MLNSVEGTLKNILTYEKWHDPCFGDLLGVYKKLPTIHKSGDPFRE